MRIIGYAPLAKSAVYVRPVSLLLPLVMKYRLSNDRNFTVHFGGTRGAVGLLCVVANYSHWRRVGGAFSCVCEFACLSEGQSIDWRQC